MRKHWIDYLRVAAILAVITIHVTASYYSRFGQISQAEWWFANFLNAASRYAVPVFVMISGAVLLGKDVTIAQFYAKRSARLIPPFVFWTLFFIGFRVYLGMDMSGLIYFLKFGLLTHGQAYYHLWYLTMFMCLMLFAPFLNQFINGSKPTATELGVLLAVLFLFYVFNSVSTAWEDVMGREMIWFGLFPWFIAYFLGGYYLDRHGERLPLKRTTLLAGIVLIVLAGAALNYDVARKYNVVSDHHVLDSAGFLVFGLSFLVFLLAKKSESILRESRIISIISEASFGMYLIHPVFIHFADWGVAELGIDHYSVVVLIPVVWVVTVIASLVSIVLLRKIPVMRHIC